MCPLFLEIVENPNTRQNNLRFGIERFKEI